MQPPVVDTSGWQRLLSIVKGIEGKVVRVGVHDGEISDIALIHEFGAPSAGIPERSFLRQTFQNKRDQINALRKNLLARVLTNQMTEHQALGLLGAFVAGAIKTTITSDGEFAPLAASTIRAKGSSRPLVDKGQLISSIAWQVVD